MKLSIQKQLQSDLLLIILIIPLHIIFYDSLIINLELKCINSDTPFEKKIINHENSGIETKCPNLYSEDIDKNLCDVNNCKYYPIDELRSSKDMGNFNIFHNLSMVENKFDVLYKKIWYYS